MADGHTLHTCILTLQWALQHPVLAQDTSLGCLRQHLVEGHGSLKQHPSYSSALTVLGMTSPY